MALLVHSLDRRAAIFICADHFAVVNGYELPLMCLEQIRQKATERLLFWLQTMAFLLPPGFTFLPGHQSPVVFNPDDHGHGLSLLLQDHRPLLQLSDINIPDAGGSSLSELQFLDDSRYLYLPQSSVVRFV